MPNSITAPYGLETNNPQPEIKRYYNLAKTPYTSTAQVLSEVLPALRYPGQTFNVNKVDYYFKEGTDDSDLVVKTPTASNLGLEGVSVYKEFSGNNYKFKKLKSTDGSVVLTPDEDSINITLSPVVIGSIKTFYVNSSYTGTDADGSITRPFTTFDAARTAYMGETSPGVPTTDILNPQYKGSKIILQTGASTAVNPTMNGLVLEFQNNSILTYTGNDDYMFDTEVLYSLLTPNPTTGDIPTDIKVTLTGKGGLTRAGLGSTKVGLIRGMGSNRNGLGTVAGKVSQIAVGINEDDKITLYERTDYPSSTWTSPNGGNATNASNVPLENTYGFPILYSLILVPTNPLVFIQYEAKAPNNWGVSMGGTVNFITLVNSAIKAIDTLVYGNKLNFLVNGVRVATVPDSPGGTTVTKLSGNEYYPPHPNRRMIELSGSNSNIYCNEIQVNDVGGFTTTGVTDFFYILEDSGVANGTLQISSNYYIKNLINVLDVSNTSTGFTLDTGLSGANIRVLKGENFLATTKPAFTIAMPKSTVGSFNNKSTSATVITANTNGTLSSFFGRPVMSGIGDATNDANAEAPPLNLIKNGLYFNTTTGGLDIVN